MDSLLLPPAELDALTSAGRQALHDDLRRGWHVKQAIGARNQVRLKRCFDAAGPLHHPVFGQLTLVVDPVVYETMRQEHGEQCWRDPAFRRAFARANPEANIRSKSGKTTLLVNGHRGSAGVCTA